jgi:hypothetical protein
VVVRLALLAESGNFKFRHQVCCLNELQSSGDSYSRAYTITVQQSVRIDVAQYIVTRFHRYAGHLAALHVIFDRPLPSEPSAG